VKAWYLSQSPRDQKLVLLLGALIVLTLLYLLLWKPVSDGLEERRTRLEGQRNALQWMHDAAAEARALGGSGGGQSRQRSGKAPYLLVDEAVRRAGLGTPKRIEPAGGKGARVQFDSVAFDKLLPMLGELQEDRGLNVSSANFQLSGGSGLVSARISLEAGE